MEALLQDLAAILEKEERCHGELADCLRQERRAVASRSLEALGSVSARKETLMLQLKVLQESRLQAVARLAAHAGLEGEGNVPLSTLAARIGGAWGEALERQRRRLEAAAQEVRRLNLENLELMERSLFYVQESLHFLTQFQAQGTTYSATGRMKEERGSRVARSV